MSQLTRKRKHLPMSLTCGKKRVQSQSAGSEGARMRGVCSSAPHARTHTELCRQQGGRTHAGRPSTGASRALTIQHSSFLLPSVSALIITLKMATSSPASACRVRHEPSERAPSPTTAAERRAGRHGWRAIKRQRPQQGEKQRVHVTVAVDRLLPHFWLPLRALLQLFALTLPNQITFV